MADLKQAAILVFTHLAPLLATAILFSCVARAATQRRFSIGSLFVAMTAICVIAGIIAAPHDWR
jgi:hypothetical protein